MKTYNQLDSDNNYLVTVIAEELDYSKTFEVKAPREGLAKTRAGMMASDEGVKFNGAFVDYIVEEVK